MKLSRAHNEYHLGYGEFENQKKQNAAHLHRFEYFLCGCEAAFDKECGEKAGAQYDAVNEWPQERSCRASKRAWVVTSENY